MLKIRLKRVGRRNDPSYRVVVTEATASPKSGKSVEILGSYNPKNNQKSIDAERASYWISVGAQPSGTVHNLLVDAGVLKAGKINVLPKKSPIKKEVTEEKATPAPQSGSDEQKGGEEEAPAETPAEEALAEETSTENETPKEETAVETATESNAKEEVVEEVATAANAEGESEDNKKKDNSEDKPEEGSA